MESLLTMCQLFSAIRFDLKNNIKKKLFSIHPIRHAAERRRPDTSAGHSTAVHALRSVNLDFSWRGVRWMLIILSFEVEQPWRHKSLI